MDTFYINDFEPSPNSIQRYANQFIYTEVVYTHFVSKLVGSSSVLWNLTNPATTYISQKVSKTNSTFAIKITGNHCRYIFGHITHSSQGSNSSAKLLPEGDSLFIVCWWITDSVVTAFLKSNERISTNRVTYHILYKVHIQYQYKTIHSENPRHIQNFKIT